MFNNKPVWFIIQILLWCFFEEKNFIKYFCTFDIVLIAILPGPGREGEIRIRGGGRVQFAAQTEGFWAKGTSERQMIMTSKVNREGRGEVDIEAIKVLLNIINIIGKKV